MIKTKHLLPLALFSALLWSCQDLDSSPKALVNILLIDAPAKWDSVVVEIQGVELEFVPNSRQGGDVQRIFLPYELGNKQVDISRFVGGRSLPVARNEMQLGVITGITLRLGTGNSLYLNKEKFPLELPDGKIDYFQSLNIDLEQGISYDIVLDFDLAKSIQVTGSNPLALKFNPTIAAFSGFGKGELTGTTSPTEIRPVIYAIKGTDSLSTHTNSGGNFLFRLEPGDYTVFIDPKDSRYNANTILNVKVEQGKKTPLERITLTRK
ncbi:protein of unknown function [Algoriphagus alkaliphilus]|uniref:DUF4382 domain-containing protein n=1 Tax=Algoriphagus alkaliphilus TaxID=279824 RepID=A0A1G5UX59_9BACT|nr:DUF4382 domain-containing protein [Algoriphagus alkaliphilus]SDA37617.1 protein of unknown function [Algoriphagus alkaliphilus]